MSFRKLLDPTRHEFQVLFCVANTAWISAFKGIWTVIFEGLTCILGFSLTGTINHRPHLVSASSCLELLAGHICWPRMYSQIHFQAKECTEVRFQVFHWGKLHPYRDNSCIKSTHRKLTGLDTLIMQHLKVKIEDSPLHQLRISSPPPSDKRTNLLRQFLSLLSGYGLLLHVIQFGNGLGVITKINLKLTRDSLRRFNMQDIIDVSGLST